MDPKRWINVTAPPWPSSPLSPTPSDRQATAREHLDQPGDDRLQQRLQFVVCGRTGFDEYRHTIAAAPVHRVQHQAVGWHQRSNRFLRITKPLIFIGSVTDELRQSGTCGLIGLGEETLSVLLHQAVQRGLLGSVALVADRGAIAMRPPGVVSVGLHALGMGNLGWCSFSGRAGRCIRLWGITYSHRHCNGPAAAQYLARQRRAGTGLGVRDEAGRVLLHQAVQRGLLGAVAFVVQRGAVRRPLGLPAGGVHDGLPKR